MAKVTWLGEGEGGARETTWAGRTFKIGEAVEIEDEGVLERAARNKFFKVEGAKKPAAKPESVPAPSTQSPLGPVPKPGEPKPAETKKP